LASIEIPGGAAAAIELAAGSAIRLVNTHGSQVADTWCLSAADVTEYLSVEHTRRMLSRLFTEPHDVLYSNRRTPMLVLEEDTSGCRHDMLLACCDEWLYRFYDCPVGHANCHDNFVNALGRCGIAVEFVPNPINFWMNVSVHDNNRLALNAPTSKPGDFVVLRALQDVVVVFSACPMDITPVNGEDRIPKSISYEIVGGVESNHVDGDTND
jgi:uncharacterized protein YcgI (DUF1989 family)